jgi:phosphoribosylformimino-5-aminoimidazole carboxamide ribotide isomerase
MIILPAIDLMGGEVVRLRQGKAGEKTVYSNDPVAFARKWETEGANYLHIVDLDAAFSGRLHNLEWVRKIAASVSIPCELGGGMRSEEAIRAAIDVGVARVVIGTRASESIDFVAQMAQKFGGDKIAVGIDARNGIVSIKGWTESAGVRALDLARKAEQAGARTIIYTDISTDGMLEGPNFAEIRQMLDSLECQLIASGGVSKADDVLRLARMDRLHGVIVGKALYDGAMNLQKVLLQLNTSIAK